MKKITITQLKKKLQDYTKEELIYMLTQIYKNNLVASDYLNIELSEDDCLKEVLDEKKSILYKIFFPSRLSHSLSLREAKKVVTEFKKLCNNEMLVIDLQLYYVELGVDFTNTYGDINETFYNSIGGMFWTVTDSINKMGSEEKYKYFETRLINVARNTDGIGWGFNDEICDALCSLKWFDGNF